MHILNLLLTLATAAPAQATNTPLDLLPKDIRPAQVVVSPDQSHFAWISRDAESFSVVVDGKKQKPYDWIILGKADFTGDSKHVVYGVRRRGKALMIVDGNEGQSLDSISDWLIGSGGPHIAYATKHNNRAHAMLDDVPGPPFDFVRLDALAGDGT